MRKILITALFAAIAMPAFATDSGDAAFDLLSKYSAEKQQKNYIKLQSTIDMADAIEIDAKISEIYGIPEVSRAGLKVWEIENTRGNGSKHTTIMCGPDGHGGVFISADRRGKALNQALKGRDETNPKSENPTKPKVSKPDWKSRERD